MMPSLTFILTGQDDLSPALDEAGDSAQRLRRRLDDVSKNGSASISELVKVTKMLAPAAIPAAASLAPIAAGAGTVAVAALAERAREHDVPWGANVICGHPGETPATLERSAAYLRKLFLQPRGTTGFLSVDPFRLYPGSPIDADRGYYEQRFGTRFHYPRWWDDGDPEFLSEWVDPSAELDWRSREALQHELLAPILAEIEGKFVYRGPARGYFLGAIRDQVAYTRPASRWPAIERWIERVAPGLSVIASAVVAIVDPQAVVLGGRIPTDLAQRLMPRIAIDNVSRRGRARPQPSIVLAEAPFDAVALGAASLPFKECFFH